MATKHTSRKTTKKGTATTPAKKHRVRWNGARNEALVKAVAGGINNLGDLTTHLRGHAAFSDVQSRTKAITEQKVAAHLTQLRKKGVKLERMAYRGGSQVDVDGLNKLLGT